MIIRTVSYCIVYRYPGSDIQAAGMDLELVNEFCYLGSYIAYNGSCEKDVKVRIGKAATIFGKMRKIWKSNRISLKVKMRLYESVILSTLLYSAEVTAVDVRSY